MIFMEKEHSNKSENIMRSVIINKMVINVGTGDDKQKQESAKRLLELLTKMKPVDAISKKRIPAFKISKGSKIGAYVTIRSGVEELLKRLLAATDNKINESAITDNAVSFGIHEYIDIDGIKYDPKIGMMGMNVNLSFRRKGGMRVSEKKRRGAYVPKKHRVIGKEELKKYLQEKLNINVV